MLKHIRRPITLILLSRLVPVPKRSPVNWKIGIVRFYTKYFRTLLSLPYTINKLILDFEEDL